MFGAEGHQQRSRRRTRRVLRFGGSRIRSKWRKLRRNLMDPRPRGSDEPLRQRRILMDSSRLRDSVESLRTPRILRTGGFKKKSILPENLGQNSSTGSCSGFRPDMSWGIKREKSRRTLMSSSSPRGSDEPRGCRRILMDSSLSRGSCEPLEFRKYIIQRSPISQALYSVESWAGS